MSLKPCVSASVLPRLRGRVLACALGAALGSAAVGAQGYDPTQIGRQWLDQALKQEGTTSLPLRMELEVGQLDSRLNLAPCAKVEPYLPAGSRLWGRTRLGLRCVQGARLWNVFLPVTVKAWGPAWVLNNNVQAGALLSMDDARQVDVDWAEDSSPVVIQPEDWVGQTAARSLVAGQALRQNLLRPPQLFKMGEQVKVIVTGGGFSVVSSGQAMGAAGQGQTVRVRMGNGRTVSGTVNADGSVEVTP